MLAKRIIPCMDIADGRIVKGVNFIDLRDAGDPVEMAHIYDIAGADELAFLDISATPKGHETVVDIVREVADQVFMPLTVGGGIRTIQDMRKLLLAGAVSLEQRFRRRRVFGEAGRVDRHGVVERVNPGAGEIVALGGFGIGQ